MQPKTGGGILVRRIRFEYPADLAPHWNAARPEWSQVVNACSLLMPSLEPYLIESIREGMAQIRDPALLAEAKSYCGQEAHHFKQHRRFNDLLLAKGHEALRDYERTLEEDYARFQRERPLAFHLAYAAGFETMALAIGHMLIRMRTFFFRDADPAVSSLVLWHFVEELEHKHAAFDVYQQVVGRWGRRVRGLVFAMWHTMSRSRRAYIMLLRRDGLWGTSWASPSAAGTCGSRRARTRSCSGRRWSWPGSSRCPRWRTRSSARAVSSSAAAPSSRDSRTTSSTSSAGRR